MDDICREWSIKGCSTVIVQQDADGKWTDEFLTFGERNDEGDQVDADVSNQDPTYIPSLASDTSSKGGERMNVDRDVSLSRRDSSSHPIRNCSVSWLRASHWRMLDT